MTVPVQQPLGSVVGSSRAGPRLFEPLTLREITFRNRIMVAPMCRYSCVDGYATDWPLRAARERGAEIDYWPAQYTRAKR